jgi:hypothetical protein
VIEEKMKQNRRMKIGIFCLAMVLTILPQLYADTVPMASRYQGFLTDAGNQPFSGTCNLSFKLYEQAEGGTEVWSETHVAVLVTNGAFDVLLGSDNPFTPEIIIGNRYLGLSVNGESEMTPRSKLTSVASVLRAAVADSLSGTIDGNDIAPGSIGMEKMSFTTWKGPIGVKGDKGPVGSPGPQGATGPPGPTRLTYAVCASPNYYNHLINTNCGIGATILFMSDSPCTVTSNTGSCSATDYAGYKGECWVCSP